MGRASNGPTLGEARFRKLWEYPDDPIIAARPSATHPGGTVYFYAKHPPVVVYGGDGAAWRGNSPGIDVPPRAKDQKGNYTEDEGHYHARVEALVRKYEPFGAVGYTESGGGRGQIVFRDAAAAKRGYAKTLDEKNAGSQKKTVLEVLDAFNAKGRPDFEQYATGVFESRSDGFGDQSALLKRPYASLTPEEKAIIVNKGLRAEGYDNPAGTPMIEPLLPPADPPPNPWQRASLELAPEDRQSQWAFDAPDSGVSPASDVAPSSRAALEQRASQLGIGYAGFMPTDALLAELHQREADPAQTQDPEAAADRIEHEMDTIGVPLLDDAAAAAPPQRPVTLARDALEQRAAGLGMRVSPRLPTPWLLAGIHARERDAAPAAAAEGLADHTEREIDALATLHGLPSLDGDDDASAPGDQE